MKNIEIRNGRVLYYGNEAGYVENGRAVVDPIFQSDELSDFLAKEKLDTLWTNGVYDRLTAARETPAAGAEVPATGRAHGIVLDRYHVCGLTYLVLCHVVRPPAVSSQ